MGATSGLGTSYHSRAPVSMLIASIETKLEIQNNTDTVRSVSYLSLYIKFKVGRLRTILCDKRHDSDFPIVNFPSICSIIPVASAYGVYKFQWY